MLQILETTSKICDLIELFQIRLIDDKYKKTIWTVKMNSKDLWKVVFKAFYDFELMSCDHKDF